jgi:hypothetical protein
METAIRRFTAFRRNLSERGSHTEAQRNADDQPQYEGVVFSSGRCVIQWLTSAKSIAIFDTLEQMLQIHGHPEYGTEILWHDEHMPLEWEKMLVAHAEKRQAEFHHADMSDVTLREERDADGHLMQLQLVLPASNETLEYIYPVALP